MLKRIVVLAFAAMAALIAASPAMAADTIKGTNQAGQPETVGAELVVKYKRDTVTGVISYTTRGSETVRTLTDAAAANETKLYWHFGSNRALAQNGWTYHIGRSSIICQNPTSSPYTVIHVPGHTGSESLFDSCAFANQTYNQ